MKITVATRVSRPENRDSSGLANELISSKMPLAITAGIASKNENFRAATRSNPRILMAPIVAPDLETPGISANAWANPAIQVSDRFIAMRFR